MDKLTVLKVIDLLNQHIKEVKALPGNPVGKEQVLEELNLLINELRPELKNK